MGAGVAGVAATEATAMGAAATGAAARKQQPYEQQPANFGISSQWISKTLNGINRLVLF
jgi:hypothetical protein